MSTSKIFLLVLCGMAFFGLSIAHHAVLADPLLVGDFDGNRYVNIDDFVWLAGHWLEAGCTDPNWCDGADLDHNHYVDFEDISRFADTWQEKDFIQLARTHLSPLETLQITVSPVTSTCTITVTTPAGDLHTLGGTIADGICTASYIPSYQVGTYQVSAVADDITTETEEFDISVSSQPITIQDWQVDSDSYYPERDLTFSFTALDPNATGLTGLSAQLGDSLADSTSGQMSILRKIMAVADDGTMTARLYIYFDASGSSWSGIYSGTTVRISLYSKLGGALPAGVSLVNGTLHGAGYLSNEILNESGVYRFHTTVIANFSGSDKISYLDIMIPPTVSLSDMIFSVDSIKYYYNTGWNDRIYITEQYVTPSGSGYQLDTGSAFSSLGRLPIYLPLTPNENGLVYYSIHAADTIGETDLNAGTISENAGAYTNLWRWNDYMNTTARVYVYVDKWGYTHDYSDAILLAMDPGFNQTGLVIENWQANQTAYFPGESIQFSFDLKDTQNNPVSGFTGTIADSQPDHDGGAMYIMRKVLNIEADGSAQARLQVYFDTTGGWSDIYAGTTLQFSLYNKDGLTPLSGVALSTGFLNNDDNKLSSVLAGNSWQVQVDAACAGVDKIAYLDFAIPSGKAVSDIVFSVDQITYYRNSGWGDKIIIAGKTATESNFPKDYTGNIVFQTGDGFPGLGKFPLHLPLNPNPGGFIFYRLDSADIAENNINYGSLSGAGGDYNNAFTWNDCLITTAQVYPYVDKWWNNSAAAAAPLNLIFDAESRELALYDYDIDSRAYTMGDTRRLSATVEDAYGAGVSGFQLKDAISDSTSGKLSIVTQNVRTTTDGKNVVRLLAYFDTTGSWSDIYANTQVDITIYGPDGKSVVPAAITIQEGAINAEDYLVTTLTGNDGIYTWLIRVDKNFAGADRQVYLDFIVPDTVSASNVVFSVDHIQYFCNTGWGDSITIRNQTVSMGSFPRDYYGQYEFATGDMFGTLGRFPLYLSLNPGGASVFPKMRSTEETVLSGSMAQTGGDYIYSHDFVEVGNDFETSLCISRFGYFNNENRCTDSIMLYFSGEPRYLGGLEDAPVMLNETWQVDLDEYFFIETNYANVEYTSSDPGLVITGHIATFAPLTTDDTIHEVVITAQSVVDPDLIAFSDPFTLYAATCMNSYGCDDNDPNTVTACVQYQCVTYERENAYYMNPQGVDLCVFNKNVTMSNPFPDPNETVEICAEIANTGTTNIFNVEVNFYLDDVNTTPIGTQTIEVLPTTYMDLPLRPEKVCINWTVPVDLEGSHRIWVALSGDFPLDMQEDMTSNNYATTDFYINNPNEYISSVFGQCPAETMALADAAAMLDGDGPTCTTLYMRIPVNVVVCEDEIVCGPVMGIELSYWSTLYWPSWSGYCQEFGVPQEAITDFIRTYETLAGLGWQGAGSSLPSLTDIPGLLQPEGWGDGWLPCHPEPTMFPGIMYEGVIDPGCGGLCPVSAWDCGQGVHFDPRFSSNYYNAYDFKVSGGAKKITRCHTDVDYIEVPYQICVPGDPGDPNNSFNVPFMPFGGGPGGEGGGYGGNGPSGPGTGPNGGPPFEFEIGGPPADPNGVALNYTCYFCSTGTAESASTSDMIHCVPGTGSMAVIKNNAAKLASLQIANDTETEAACVELGMPAPDVTLFSIDGKEMNLAGLPGNEVLLLFGRTDCPHCLCKIPLLNHVQSSPQGPAVIFVALGASPAAAQKFVEDHAVSFSVFADPYRRAGRTYSIRKVPEVFLIDSEGYIKYTSQKQGHYIWQYLANRFVVGDLNAETQSLIYDWNRDGFLDLHDLEILVSGWMNELETESNDSACEWKPE